MTRRLPPSVIALFVIGTLSTIGTLGFWIAGGAHMGWTQTYVTEQRLDPITGIEYAQKTDKFVPGVDLLAVGIAAGFACELLGFAILILKRKANP